MVFRESFVFRGTRYGTYLISYLISERAYVCYRKCCWAHSWIGGVHGVPRIVRIPWY